MAGFRRRRTSSRRRRPIIRRRRIGKFVKRRIMKKAFRAKNRHEVATVKSKIVIPVYSDAAGRTTVLVNLNGRPEGTSFAATMVEYVDAGGTFVTAAFPRCVKYSDQYETVRCAAMQFRFIPTCSGAQTVNRLLDAPTGPTPGNFESRQFTPLYINYDSTTFEKIPFNMTEAEALLADKVKIKYMNYPWKWFMKTPRFRPNSLIPYVTAASVLNDQDNLAGMWHNAVTEVGGGPNTVNGCHIMMTSYASSAAGIKLGSMVITGYFVYKDFRQDV